MNAILESIVLRMEAANCLEDKVKILGLSILSPGVGSGVLGVGSGVLGVGSGALGVGSGLNVQPEVPVSLLPASQVVKLMGSMEDGQPFTVEFQKKSGELRRMLCSVDRSKKEGDTYANVQVVFDREAGKIKSFRSAYVVNIMVP